MPNCVRRPERSCGWKTPPHNRRTATDRPSSPGQREVRPGFRLHMVHRNGAKRAWTPYPARKKPSRPQAAWWQGYGPHPGSAGVPSAYMFSRGARSSSISVCLLDRGRTVRKRYHSLLLYPPQLLGSEPGQLFHGQAPSIEYKGKDLQREIVWVLSHFRHTLVVTTHASDRHPDHCATYLFVRQVLHKLQQQDPTFRPLMLTFLIHFGGWGPINENVG